MNAYYSRKKSLSPRKERQLKRVLMAECRKTGGGVGGDVGGRNIYILLKIIIFSKPFRYFFYYGWGLLKGRL